MRIALLFLWVSCLVASAGDVDRFVKSYPVTTNMCVVISEGDMEWRSTGSYTLRLHELVDDKAQPAGELYSGLVQKRDGTVENVLLIDLDGDGKKDVVVTIRNAGTGAYLSADAFRIHGKQLTLLGHVAGLDPKANVIAALKKQIQAQKK